MWTTCQKQGKNKKIKEVEDSKYIYQNKLDKFCPQHDMTYVNFKDLSRRIGSDKLLCNKPFNIAKTPKYDGYQRGLASIAYWFFDKNSSVSNTSGGAVICARSGTLITRDEYAVLQNLYAKLEKRKVFSSLKDDIWSTDVADMQLISEFNEGFQFLLCVIDVYSKYAWKKIYNFYNF